MKIPLLFVPPSDFWRDCRAVLTAFFVSATAASSLAYTGAIFTTTSDGTAVNHNIYTSKNDVYLNGGPQNQNANGLPDGDYYFQVTDPSGATLLSIDPATCRQLTVADGNVTGYYAAAPGDCHHSNGTLNNANLSTPVQLIPFDDTPNMGGEYKVWLIPVGSAVIGGDGITLLFDNRDAKTDNFKIKATSDPCIVVDLQPLRICETVLGQATLTATITGTHPNVTYTWYIDHSQTAGPNVSGPTITIDALTPGSHSYIVVAADPDAENCSDTAEVEVFVVATAACGELGCVDSPLPIIAQCLTGIPTQADPTCPDGRVLTDYVNPTPVPCGTVTRSWKCVDPATGLYSICSQDITVKDTHAPVITSCPGTQTAVADQNCSAIVNFPEATATDNCGYAITYSVGNVIVHSGDRFPVGDTVVSVLVADGCGNTDTSCSFTVTVLGTISGTKFYDLNSDGASNGADAGIPGFKIKLTDSANNVTWATTDSNGRYSVNVPASTYKVEEILPLGFWVATGPLSKTGVVISSATCQQVVNFFNNCQPIPGGHTLGFWSNRNGQALENAADFTALTAFHLRNGNGTDRDFTGTLAKNQSDLNSWLLGASASNMAYMLSAQLTATKLGLSHGFVTNPNLIVDLVKGYNVPQEIAYADTLLSANGNTVAASAQRTEQERVKTILDRINNSLGFVQPTACDVQYPK